ncbi:hypothetical protein FRC09_013599 [Ceratobasidium sp. 395]|nr:hypothetical protein FRC09_013599 [Ceratobasidium sp. 395]
MFKRKGGRVSRNASTSISANVTVLGRNQAPSTIRESSRPSLLVPKARKVTKAKLAAMQERDKARDEMLFKEQLSEAQQKELDSLRQQVSGSGFGELNPSEDLADAWVDIDLESNTGSDDGRQAEDAVVEELGLPSNSSAWSNRISAEHEAWTAQLSDLCDAYLSYRSGITLSESMEVDEGGSCVTLQLVCTGLDK